MRSHFRLNHGAAACAVTGVAAMLTSIASAQVAADSATDPAYAGGWAAGQNGGFGFGAWSFDGTQAPDNSFTTSGQQGISSSSPLGTSWTLFNLSSTAGLANAGRAITEPGGLQVGQTLETVVENPSTTHFFRGWTISLNSGNNNIYPGGPSNNPPGDTGLSQVQAYHFEYFNYGQWTVNDLSGNTGTTLVNTDTSIAGMKLDFKLTSPTTYSLTMTPLGGSAGAYTQVGTLANGGPIDWIQFQLYNNVSGGLNDTANNFEISGMTISPAPEPSTLALIGLGSAGLLFLRRRK
jgi:PEP-CTERM motif